MYKTKSDSDLVCIIQLIRIQGNKFPPHTTRIFNLKQVLIAFDKPNLGFKNIKSDIDLEAYSLNFSYKYNSN